MEQSADEELAQAFHHLHRAGAIISLLETDTGRDLRRMLEDGIVLYRRAADKGADARIARCAAGLLRAAEHLAWPACMLRAAAIAQRWRHRHGR